VVAESLSATTSAVRREFSDWLGQDLRLRQSRADAGRVNDLVRAVRRIEVILRELQVEVADHRMRLESESDRITIETAMKHSRSFIRLKNLVRTLERKGTDQSEGPRGHGESRRGEKARSVDYSDDVLPRIAGRSKLE